MKALMVFYGLKSMTTAEKVGVWLSFNFPFRVLSYWAEASGLQENKNEYSFTPCRAYEGLPDVNLYGEMQVTTKRIIGNQTQLTIKLDQSATDESVICAVIEMPDIYLKKSYGSILAVSSLTPTRVAMYSFPAGNYYYDVELS